MDGSFSSKINTSEYPPCLLIHAGTSSLDSIPFSVHSNIISSVSNGILGALAVSGNFLILLTIKKTPSLHTPSNLVLFGLALSEVCVGGLVQPLFIIFQTYKIKLFTPEATSSDGLSGDFQTLCMLGLIANCSGVFFAFVAFTHLGFVSFERYLAITLHLRYAALVTNSRVIKGIIGIWVFGGSVATWLFLADDDDTRVRQVIYFAIACGFFVFFVTVYCNVQIAVILRRHIRAIQCQRQQTVSVMYVTKFKRSAASMVYVVTLFFLSGVPYCVATLLRITRKDASPVVMLRALNLTIPLLFANSALNPMVYFWRFRDMRRAGKNLVRKMCGSLKEGTRKKRTAKVEPTRRAACSTVKNDS